MVIRIQNPRNTVNELATKRGLPQLGPGHQLGDRLRQLQPFNDPETVPAIPAGLEDFLVSDEQPDLHPLTLLQRYSNDDKHRSLRLAGARSIYRRDEGPLTPTRLAAVQVGDTLDRNPIGTYNEGTSMPSLCVQRPDDGPLVSPGHELNHLFSYVADIAIPSLVTGLALPGAFPAQLNLTDNGLTDQQRVEAAANTRAHERMGMAALQAATESLTNEPQWPEIVDDDS